MSLYALRSIRLRWSVHMYSMPAALAISTTLLAPTAWVTAKKGTLSDAIVDPRSVQGPFLTPYGSKQLLALRTCAVRPGNFRPDFESHQESSEMPSLSAAARV